MDQDINKGEFRLFPVSPTFQNDFTYEMVKEFLLVEKDYSGKGKAAFVKALVFNI